QGAITKTGSRYARRLLVEAPAPREAHAGGEEQGLGVPNPRISDLRTVARCARRLPCEHDATRLNDWAIQPAPLTNAPPYQLSSFCASLTVARPSASITSGRSSSRATSLSVTRYGRTGRRGSR